MSYVVYWVEHLRDGHEDGAKVLPDIASAKTFMQELASGPSSSTLAIRLFELGKEILLKRKRVTKEEKVIVREETEFEIEEPK